jgi:hypothetical protein
LLTRNIFENALTMGLVISLANPHNAKQVVTKIKGNIRSFGTMGLLLLLLIVFILGLDEYR